MNILLTGASGFLGSSLLEKICQRNEDSVYAVSRTTPKFVDANYNFQRIGELYDVDWEKILVGKDVVIHTAALTDGISAAGPIKAKEFQRVNVDATLKLAVAAMKSNVRRFIFISSIKVNGELTLPGEKFSEQQKPAPSDLYGSSKLEAEIQLFKACKDSKMEIVIIRPPLIYGKGVKGNFAKLIKLSRLRIPLPLGALSNHRSIVSVDNVIDLIIVCCKHPSAANEVFMVSDQKSLSVTELLSLLSKASGSNLILFPIPAKFLNFMFKIIGKKRLVLDCLVI